MSSFSVLETYWSLSTATVLIRPRTAEVPTLIAVVIPDSDKTRDGFWQIGASSFDPEGVITMLNYGAISCALSIFLLTGCATPSTVDRSARIHDIRISGHALITPVELYATVGDEIRWHNLLEAPIHLGFLGVNPVKEVSCEKGLKTWFGDIKDFVTIRAGDYVSLCFLRSRTVRYNVWTDLADPIHSMSPTAVIHLDETAS
jgi:hypothetical protein